MPSYLDKVIYMLYSWKIFIYIEPMKEIKHTRGALFHELPCFLQIKSRKYAGKSGLNVKDPMVHNWCHKSCLVFLVSIPLLTSIS